jgi:hypothetical protein
MKKIIIILLIFGAIFKNASAQTTPVTDTLAYLQTIVANKANYIGQPFSILRNNLQIQIKFFSIGRGIWTDINKETSTDFAFYFPQNADEIYLTYPSLKISWATPLNANQSDILWKNHNGGGWATDVAALYSTGIISDIQIRE